MMEMTTRVEIDFEPEYTIKIPPIERFVGRVEIMLPAHHYKLYDLSMGGILPGAHIGSDGRAWCLKMDIPEPGMNAGDMLKFLREAESQIRELWAVVQGELDKNYLMERKGK